MRPLAPPHRRREAPARRGFTLVELVIVVGVVATIITLAAPSLRNMILMQRLRSVTNQIVTDFQFGRNEAVSRGVLLKISFKTDATQTCYTLFTGAANNTRCDCRLGAGSACPAGLTEVRTVSVPVSSGVTVSLPIVANLAFNPVNGGLMAIPTDMDPSPIGRFIARTTIGNSHTLNAELGASGRAQVCTPALSDMTEPACAP